MVGNNVTPLCKNYTFDAYFQAYVLYKHYVCKTLCDIFSNKMIHTNRLIIDIKIFDITEMMIFFLCVSSSLTDVSH